MKRAILFSAIVSAIIGLLGSGMETPSGAGQETEVAKTPSDPLKIDTPREELDKVAQELIARLPEPKLKELQAQLKAAHKTYEEHLREYEALEQEVTEVVLKTPDAQHDPELRRLNEELNRRFKRLQADNEAINKLTAEFNMRLSSAAERHFGIAENARAEVKQ